MEDVQTLLTTTSCIKYQQADKKVITALDRNVVIRYNQMKEMRFKKWWETKYIKDENIYRSTSKQNTDNKIETEIISLSTNYVNKQVNQNIVHDDKS